MKNNHLVSACVIGVWFTTVVVLFIAGKKAFFEQEENGCEMTYMFEYPEYIRINLKKKISKQYPRYGLYLYGEGSYAQEQRRSVSPNGIPVLFIPGNAGSYRQVRSLASIALRKAERHRNHFNYFTIDLDEDFSGLYGGVLMEQVNFVYSCLRHIIRMYERKTSDSVILIGHSMGGMIARALFTLDNFQSKFVSVIVTLGTPQLAPVVPFDSHLNTFYFRVNNFWKDSPSVTNLSVISLAGGARDILVPARYCFLPRNMHVNLQYSAVTTAVPAIWLTIDHLALCWCKQLILVINRALFALIDEDNHTNGITKDRIKHVRVLRQYFGVFDHENEEILSKSRFDQSPTIYNKTSLWNHFQQISISGTLLIRVNTSDSDAQFMALSNSLGDISITSCQSLEIDGCIGSKLISFQALPKTSKKKAGFVHLTSLTNISYIKVSSLTHKPQLAMQFLPRHDTNEQFEKFRITSGVQRFLSSRYLFMNISLPMIRNCFDVYLITIEKINCENDRDGLFTGRIHLPWSQEDVYAKSSQSTELAILLKVHISKPTTVFEFAQLHVWKTDECSLEVTVEYQFAKTLGRIFVLYAPFVPQWIYSWIMIVVVIQLGQMSDKNICLSVWSIAISCTLPNFIPLFVLLCSELLMKSLTGSVGWFISLSRGFDGLVLYDWALPSCFIILTAFVIFLALHIFLEIILSFLASFLLLFSSKHVEPQTQTSTTVLVLLYSSLALVVFCLMSLCSSLAIYFLTIVSFIHCCKTTAKSRIFTSEVNNFNKLEVANKLNFSKLLLSFLLVVSFQTTPAFIVWLKVLPTSWFLPSDPFRTLVLLLIPTVLCCLEMQVRRPPRYAAYLVLFMWSVGCLLHSLDRFPYIFGFILLAVNFLVFDKHNKHKKN